MKIFLMWMPAGGTPSTRSMCQVFFDDAVAMAEDTAARANRLGLLAWEEPTGP